MMKKAIFLGLLAGAAALPAHAAETLYLKNGDKLSGDIGAFNAGTVNIQTTYGLFPVPLTEISGVESVNTRLKTRIENAMKIAQMNAQTQRPMPQQMQPQMQMQAFATEPVTLTPTAAAPAPKVEEIAAASPAAGGEDKRKLFGADFTGNVNLGLGLTTGNSEKNNINLDGEAKLRWKKHRTNFEAEYNREEEDDILSTDDRMAALTHDYFFMPKWFVEGAGKWEQDDISNLDQRITLSGGLGYQPYERDDLELKFVVGPGYRKEEFADGTDDSYLTGEWAMDYMQKFYEDAFRVFHNHDLSVPADETDSYVFTSQSGIRVPIHAGVIATGQIDFDWQNNPPAGTVEDDTIYTVKLGYEW